MKVHIRNALIIVAVAVGLFIAAEQTGMTGTDISGSVIYFLIWES